MLLVHNNNNQDVSPTPGFVLELNLQSVSLVGTGNALPSLDRRRLMLSVARELAFIPLGDHPHMMSANSLGFLTPLPSTQFTQPPFLQ